MKMSKGLTDNEESFLNGLVWEGITDPNQQANVMAQIKAESNFKPQEESLNYSAKRLLEVFPSKFNNLADAQAVVNAGQEAIGNRVYGGRMGNSPTEGHQYRGRGYVQLTGKDNYQTYGDLIGKDLIGNPDLANDPEVARDIAIAYFKQRDPDLNDIGSVTRAVGPANVEDAITERTEYANDFKTRIPEDITSTAKNKLMDLGMAAKEGVTSLYDDSMNWLDGFNASPEPEAASTYTAVSGDNPYTIAQRHGISLEELASLNPDVGTALQQGQLGVGQQLNVRYTDL